MPRTAGGHLAVVERLLQAGASPTKTNAREEMAAALALNHGHLAVLRILLEHGGEIRLPAPTVADPGQGSQGQPRTQAASAAAVAGIPEAVPGSPCLQLANACRGWQLGFSTGLGHRSKPTSLAVLQEERKRYRLLLLALLGTQAGSRAGAGTAGDSSSRLATVDGAACNDTGGSGATAVLHLRQLATPASLAHAAAGSEPLLDALLAAGLSVGSVDPADGSFPLLAAAHLGWQPMARLLAREADPNQADPRGTTVLMLLATRPAMLETAQQLLRWHAERAAAAERAEQGAAAGAGAAPAAPAVAQPQPPVPAQQPAAAEYAAQPEQERQQPLPQFSQEQQQPFQAPPQQEQQQPLERPQVQPLLDLGRLDAEGRDAVGIALAAKNRRFAEELLAYLTVAGAPPALRGDAAARAAAVATKAFDLLAERRAKSLADINAPHGGQQLLLAQVGLPV